MIHHQNTALFKGWMTKKGSCFYVHGSQTFDDKLGRVHSFQLLFGVDAASNFNYQIKLPFMINQNHGQIFTMVEDQ